MHRYYVMCQTLKLRHQGKIKTIFIYCIVQIN
jgi:hypothetical protein